MKLDMTFKESNQSFDMQFGKTNVVHDGENGATFTPYVSPEGIISWTNNRELENPEPVNIKGKTGEAGYTPQKNIDYFDGEKGDSAYEVAVKNGFKGSEEEWLESLKGKGGDANITAEGIETALGYKPAKKSDVTNLSEEFTEYVENDLDWFGLGTAIPTNADLDTYTTYGKFYCSTESKTQSLKNCPTKTNFSMWVFDRTGYMSQLIITLGGKMYIRSRDSSKWRAWIAYTTSEEIADLTASVKAELLTEVEEIVGDFAVQPDWSQTDDTKSDYIKNKPFGEVVESVVAYDKVTINLEWDDLEEGHITYLPINGWTPVIGEKYTIVLDDIEYKCEAYDSDGNVEMYEIGKDLTESEIIAFFMPGYGEFFLLAKEGGEHTFSILKSQTRVKKIDEKYLPNTINLEVTYEDGSIGTLVIYGEVL